MSSGARQSCGTRVPAMINRARKADKSRQALACLRAQPAPPPHLLSALRATIAGALRAPHAHPASTYRQRVVVDYRQVRVSEWQQFGPQPCLPVIHEVMAFVVTIARAD